MKPDMNEEDITGFHVKLHFGSDIKRSMEVLPKKYHSLWFHPLLIDS